MSLNNLKNSIVALVVIALLLGAFVLALDAFQADMGTDIACANVTGVNSESISFVDNTTDRGCFNSSGEEYSTTTAFDAVDEGLIGSANATDYLSTIGTLIGVAALISVVIGAFYLIKR